MPSLDAETQDFLDRFDSLPDTLVDHRSRLAPIPMEGHYGYGADVKLVRMAGPHVRGPLRIFRPRAMKEKLPLLLYFHGGAWTDGSPHSHDLWLHRIASRARVAIASIDDALPDDLSLTARLQAADCIAADLRTGAADLGLDQTCFAIGGDSIGGYFAAALALAVTNRRAWQPCALLLVCPLILGREETPSRREFASGPWLTTGVLDSMLDLVQHDHSDVVDPLPSTAGRRQLEGGAETVIITAELDPLRDEGESYARSLMRAGVNVAATRYLGAIHDFMMIGDLADSPSSKAAFEQLIDALVKLAKPFRQA